MKDKATVTLRRKASGEIIGEFLNEKGEVVSSRDFGIVTEAEFLRILRLMGEQFPDLAGMEIEKNENLS